MIFLAALEELERNDRRQIEDLYQKYSDRVKALAQSITNEKNVSDDVVNDTFMKVIKYKDKFIGKAENEQLRLLIICVRSVCFNYLNKKNKFHFEPFDNIKGETDVTRTAAEPTSDFDLLGILVKKETVEFLKDSINKLDHPAREIVILKFYHEMKNVEIAEFFNMKPSTVASIVHRSLKRLRNEIGGYLYDEH
ncbi:MAG: RNA polymerase sigma factor [Clostridia bacterium]|nr:RNA polymerase sigma factor [Clostridia bacterium]